MVPPMNAPIGMVPQMIVRTVAFMRPCTRSGVMAWRRLTCVMLYTGLTKLPTKSEAISSGIANPYWASGTDPDARRDPRRAQCTKQAANSARGENHTDDTRRQVQEAVGKDQVDGGHHVSAEVRRRGAAGDARYGRVAEHESDPFQHLGEESAVACLR